MHDGDREQTRVSDMTPDVAEQGGAPGSSGEILWLSSREAARRLGITTRTLYRLIDEGRLPAYRLGRVIRLQQREVDAFIDEVRITPGELGHLYADAAGDDDA